MCSKAPHSPAASRERGRAAPGQNAGRSRSRQPARSSASCGARAAKLASARAGSRRCRLSAVGAAASASRCTYANAHAGFGCCRPASLSCTPNSVGTWFDSRGTVVGRGCCRSASVLPLPEAREHASAPSRACVQGQTSRGCLEADSGPARARQPRAARATKPEHTSTCLGWSWRAAAQAPSQCQTTLACYAQARTRQPMLWSVLKPGGL